MYALTRTSKCNVVSSYHTLQTSKVEDSPGRCSYREKYVTPNRPTALITPTLLDSARQQNASNAYYEHHVAFFKEKKSAEASS
jgi:hypothetical protein